MKLFLSWHVWQDEYRTGNPVKKNVHTFNHPTDTLDNNNSHTNNKTIFTELYSALSEQFLFQAMVASSLGHEFLVRPLLHDFSFLHEDNVIGLLHRAQLMSHQQDRQTTRQNLPKHLRHRRMKYRVRRID